jgi:phage-related protein (TIGR01555 family)
MPDENPQDVRLDNAPAEPPIDIALFNGASQLLAPGFNPQLAQTNLTSFIPMLTNNIYAPLTLNWTILMYFYKTHGIIQTAIDEPVLDAFRGGLDLHSKDLDADELHQVSALIDELEMVQKLVDVFVWARLFGGSALILNTEADPSNPMNPGELAGRIKFYDAIRWELGSPKRFSERYTFYGQTLDKSRVLTVTGKRAPFVLRWQLAGWGMSEVEKMVEAFNLYIRTDNVLYELLGEAKVDVFSIEGLNESLVSDQASINLRNRMQFVNGMKNFQNALLIDKNDTYEQKQITFAGLADIKRENRIAIASALRMPISKLFGISATGLSSGEDDIENYNAMVESEVREPAKPVVRRVLRILVHHLFGEDFDIDFKFRPLRVLGAVEEESIKTSKHNRFMGLYNAGVIDIHQLVDMEQKESMLPVEIDTEGMDDHPLVPQPADDFGHGAAPGGDSNGDKGEERDRDTGSPRE